MGAIFGIAAAAVVLAFGAERTYDEDAIRTLFTLLLLGGFVVFAVVSGVVAGTRFWSCVVVNLLGLPVGVLLGYRRR